MKLHTLRHGLDRAAVYLPVLTMGLLALGSYWVLRSTPRPQEPAPERAARHEPDYLMRDFSVRSHGIDGSLRSELKGSEARHYPDDDSIEVDQARLRSHGVGGKITHVSALRLNTDGAQSEYRLEGSVIVERNDSDAQSLRLTGEQLRVHGEGRYLESDLPVELVRGSDRATGDTLRYDDETGVAELRGRVHARLMPR
jgi:lipopolysaccharide export system protein LptC